MYVKSRKKHSIVYSEYLDVVSCEEYTLHYCNSTKLYLLEVVLAVVE